MNKINSRIIKKLCKPFKQSHKGQNGRLTIIGGSKLFHGASLWALKVASRIIDMVFYASVKENKPLAEELKKIAKQAFDACKCKDLARVDIIANSEGKLHVIEINTLPGFTSHSLLPKSAAAINARTDHSKIAITFFIWFSGLLISGSFCLFLILFLNPSSFVSMPSR